MILCSQPHLVRKNLVEAYGYSKTKKLNMYQIPLGTGLNTYQFVFCFFKTAQIEYMCVLFRYVADSLYQQSDTK